MFELKRSVFLRATDCFGYVAALLAPRVKKENEKKASCGIFESVSHWINQDRARINQTNTNKKKKKRQMCEFCIWTKR